MRVGRGASAKSSLSLNGPPAPRGRNEGLQAGSVFILFDTRMQTVRAVEQDISTRQERNRILEKVSVLPADSSNKCRRMYMCGSRWEGRGDWQETKRRNSQEKDPSTFEGRSHQVERWRVQEKRKEEKWKKRKKKKEMVEEVQRDHHKSEHDENEERQQGKGKQKMCKTHQSEATLGEVWEVALSPTDFGAEQAKNQCCSRRTTKKNGGCDEDATRSADQRKQMDGGSFSYQKGGSSQKGRTERE